MLPALIGLAAQLVSSLVANKKENEAKKEKEAFEQSQINKENANRRNETLSRALLQYSGGQYAPAKEKVAPPKEADLSAANTISALGSAVSALEGVKFGGGDDKAGGQAVLPVNKDVIDINTNTGDQGTMYALNNKNRKSALYNRMVG